MKKWVGFVLSVFLVLPMIAGCGSSDYPDAIELLKESQKKMQDVKSMTMDFELELDMTISSGSGDAAAKVPMKMNGKGSYDLTTDPLATHSTMKLTGTSMGQDLTQEEESYTVLDGEEMVSYSSKNGEWTKSSSTFEGITDMIEEMYSEDNMEIIEKLDLEVVDTKQVGKKDTYVLEVSITNKTFESLIDQDDPTAKMQLSMIESTLGKDFSFVISMYIDQDSKELVKISADFSKIIETIAPLFLGMSEDMPKMDIKSKKCEMSAIFSGYNKVKTIKVPEDVKNSAIDYSMYDFDSGDYDDYDDYEDSGDYE